MVIGRQALVYIHKPGAQFPGQRTHIAAADFVLNAAMDQRADACENCCGS